ncbi:N-acetylmannosamine kinase [Photobacterium damselae]|uniref:N-acetylmannosamine kinase n=1 Tax=Photobacterium damselae TaxID=38293 RepID=UPI001EE0049D|nr:N-acetylmannosamine kinase [Photobacterium damselae]MCG3844053.1 N-acetylmannosamine kinase [Photobacterium damselae]
MKSVLAVDIGGTKIACAIVRDGQVSNRQQIATPSSQQPEAMTEALRQLLTPYIGQVEQVAVASTGIIDHGILKALNPANLGGLNHYPLQQEIIAIMGCNVDVINDAQAAAWAEFKALEQPVNNMAFITVSTGVGAGIVLNGQLQVGPRGIAGHAGHTVADPHGPRCGCGRIGCVEAIASGTAIAKQTSQRWGEECTGKEAYQAFLAGDPHATFCVENSAKAIANLIADLTITLDLDTVTLGGSVGLARGYRELVAAQLAELPTVYRPKLVAAKTQADAGLVGVALWVNETNL